MPTVLTFTTGGLNAILGAFGFTLFRTGCRYSVVILAIALVHAAGWLSRRQRHAEAGAASDTLRVGVITAVIGLTALILWDQVPRGPTAEQQAQLDAIATGPRSLSAITYNRHVPGGPELPALPNHRVVRAKGPASVGGVGAARGLAGMYAVAISGIAGRPPLLTAQTIADFGQIQSVGHNLVNRMHAVFAVGFQATDHVYPGLGQGAFGHGGAAGSQAFADPRSGLA